jgi:flagellar protein FlbT
MPLKIQIKSGQRIIINGAVIENVSPKTVSLLIKNEASMLREDDVLSPEDAATPASRLYYALQCLYLFPHAKDWYLPLFKELSDSYVRAAPSSRDIIDAVNALVEGNHYYSALKKAQELIEHEGKVLSHAQEQFTQELLGSAGTGQSPGDRSLGADPGSLANEGKPAKG